MIINLVSLFLLALSLQSCVLLLSRLFHLVPISAPLYPSAIVCGLEVAGLTFSTHSLPLCISRIPRFISQIIKFECYNCRGVMCSGSRWST
ncbi:hypothetical protein F5B21DRAFT_107753 [Xylaria acuta]|nr:hypothetical protein F5B21DRAFT_107753 [Xylaria acuta]